MCVLNILLLYATIFSNFKVISGVEILDFIVPEPLESGSVDHVILDCNYDFLEGEKDQLDIKWYFNEESNPFFIWIPSLKGQPFLMNDLFNQSLDLKYTVVDNDDEYKSFRALKIKNPTIKHSGTYKCKVSSFTDEDFKVKLLIIYSPPVFIGFTRDVVNDNEFMNLNCSFSRVYPKPLTKITWTTSDGETYSTEPDDETTFENEDGLFDVNVRTTLNISDIPIGVFNVSCDLELPETNYQISKSFPYEKVFDGDEEEDSSGGSGLYYVREYTGEEDDVFSGSGDLEDYSGSSSGYIIEDYFGSSSGYLLEDYSGSASGFIEDYSGSSSGSIEDFSGSTSGEIISDSNEDDDYVLIQNEDEEDSTEKETKDSSSSTSINSFRMKKSRSLLYILSVLLLLFHLSD